MNSVNFSFEADRTNNSGMNRNYREANYQQGARTDNYNNQQVRRTNNFSSGNSNNRGRRGGGSAGNNFRSGTQSDVGTGGELNLLIFIEISFEQKKNEIDEASECGDASAQPTGNIRKHRDWASQVDSEQQETGYNTDSAVESGSNPQGVDPQSNRRERHYDRPNYASRPGYNGRRRNNDNDGTIYNDFENNNGQLKRRSIDRKTTFDFFFFLQIRLNNITEIIEIDISVHVPITEIDSEGIEDIAVTTIVTTIITTTISLKNITKRITASVKRATRNSLTTAQIRVEICHQKI